MMAEGVDGLHFDLEMGLEGVYALALDRVGALKEVVILNIL